MRAGINEMTALSISSRRAAASDAKSSTLDVSAAVPADVASEVARATYSTPRRRAIHSKISLERYGFRRKSSQPAAITLVRCEANTDAVTATIFSSEPNWTE